MNALDTALADIAALGAKHTAQQHRVDTDARMVFLRRLSNETRFDPRDGMAGIAGMIAYRTGSVSARHARIGALIRTRTAQLGGYRKMARFNLECAARAKTEEVFRTAREKIDADLVRIDRVLEAV